MAATDVPLDHIQHHKLSFFATDGPHTGAIESRWIAVTSSYTDDSWGVLWKDKIRHCYWQYPLLQLVISFR